LNLDPTQSEIKNVLRSCRFGNT